VFTRGEGDATATELASAAGVVKGAYILADTDDTPDVILIATGSEVQLALAARDQLATDGIAARVVSAPSLEWFAEQDDTYREHVLPAAVKARVSVEAGSALSWHAIVGTTGRTVAIDHFGASADYKTLYAKFGFTAEAVVEAARQTIQENNA
jgi:transketolase